MPMVVLRKKGKVVMKWMPNDGVHLIDMDEPVELQAKVPETEELMTLPKLTLLEMLEQANYIGSVSKLTRADLAELCATHWDKVVKAYAVNLSAWGVVSPQDSNMAVKHLNVKSFFTPFTSFISVNGNIAYQFHSNDATKFQSLFVALRGEGCFIGNPDQNVDFILKKGTSAAYNHEFMINWGCDGETFYITPFLLAGTLGVRKPMKKEEMLSKLISKSRDKIVKKHDTSLAQSIETPAPILFANAITQIDARIASYREKMMNGTLKMENLIETIDDEKTSFLIKVFSFKTNESTEEKLLEVVDVVYPDAVICEEIIPHIKRVKLDIISFIVEFYGREFHMERGTNILYDNQKFLKLLMNAQSYRKGLRVGTQTEQVAVADVAQSSSYCPVS